MAGENIFKQQRQPINAGDLDSDSEAGIASMRAHLNAGVEASGGDVPPAVQQAMHQMNMQQPMTDASAMHQNARRLLRQTAQDQDANKKNDQFNPVFEQQPSIRQVAAQNRFNDFKDPQFESIMQKINLKKGYEEIELPSKGKFYLNGEGPNNGILHIRRMTGHEQTILTSSRLVKKNTALNMVFKECIGEQLNPDLLLDEDRNYILIYLRGISYSQLYDVEIKCPQCTKSFQHQIDLGSVPVDYCPDNFGPAQLTETLPDTGLQIRYRFSNGRDDTSITERKEFRIKEFSSDVIDDTNIFRASLLIEEIDGVTNKTMIEHILRNLPIGDMTYIQELINDPPFGVDSNIGIICPFCAHEFTVDMPMALGFFFPKSNSQKKKLQQG